jgi:hypothetical protein
MEQRIINAVEAIIRDLSDRRGLRQEWEQIDDDIQEEIKETWAWIIRDSVW